MPPSRRRACDRISLPRLGQAAAAVAAVAVALFAGVGAAPASDPCSISWDGGAGTMLWVDAANWTEDRLPGAADEACIGSGAGVDFGGSATVGGLRVDGALSVTGLGDLTVAGTQESGGDGTLTLKSGRLTLDGAMAVAAFRQAGGTLLGAGTLSTPDFLWSGGAEVGSGTTKVTGAGAELALSGAVHTLDASRRLRIDTGAEAAWTAGDLELRDHARLENAGLLDVRGDQDFSGCCGSAMTVVNEAGATIRKSTGDGETKLTYAFANDGALEVRTGTFSIAGGDVPGRSSGGTFDVSDGATLAFTGSDFTLGAPSSVTGHGSGGLLFKFGQARLAGSVQAPVTMDGPSAYAFFNSDVSLPSVRLDRGFLSGTGRIATPDFRWNGGVQSGSGTTEIAAGGPGLAIAGDREHDLYQRRLEVDTGAVAAWTEGTIAMTESALIENGGLFDVRGDLSLSGCCDPHPRVHNAPGGTFRKSQGDGRAAVGYPFANDGTIEADSGTLSLDGGLESYDASDRLGGGTYVVRGTLEFPGARIVRNAAGLVLDGPGSSVQDSRGRDGLRDLSANEASGRLTVTGGRELALNVPDRELENAGSVTVGAASALRAGGEYRQSAGLTTLAAPSSRLGGSAAWIDGGVLRGSGTVESSLTNAGEVQPGLSPGVLTVTGDYAQAAGGALTMEIGGLEGGAAHDRLDVGGAASLAGALRIETVGGFAPATGDGFELIRHSDEDGEFDAVSGLAPDAGHSYQPPEYEPGGTWLRAAAVPAVTIRDASVAEGDAGDVPATLEVSLSFAPARTVRIAWTAADGSATAPDDYQAVGGTLTIPHGHDSATLTVPVHGDTVHEPDEDLHVNLSAPVAATIARGSATATILDDDPPPASKPPGRAPHPATPPATHATAPPAPCVDRLAPRSSFRRAKRPVRVGRRRLVMRGTALDLGCGSVRRVAVAIGRRQPGSRRKCRFLKRNGRLGRTVRCRRPRYLPARGAARWRLRVRLRAGLPRGRYTVQTRATDAAGNREWKLRRRGRRSRNALTLRVR